MKSLPQSKTVTGKTSLIVETTYVVIELVDLIKDGSPGTERNMKLSCLIIFVSEIFLAFPDSVGGRNNDMKGSEIHDYVTL